MLQHHHLLSFPLTHIVQRFMYTDNAIPLASCASPGASMTTCVSGMRTTQQTTHAICFASADKRRGRHPGACLYAICLGASICGLLGLPEENQPCPLISLDEDVHHSRYTV